jgi:hypothetical protein
MIGKHKFMFILIALFIVSSAYVVMSDQFTKDENLNAAIQQVINGQSSQATANLLEKALGKDRNNADLAGIVAGAYGIMADEGSNSAYADKAKLFASKAKALNPNSMPAKIASLGVQTYSMNKAERDRAIAGLNRVGTESPLAAKVAKFLEGKGYLLNGDKTNAVRLFQASGIAVAQSNLAETDAIIKFRAEKGLIKIPTSNLPIQRAPLAPMENKVR